MSDDNTWIALGMQLIRQNSLGGFDYAAEDIVYDEEQGVTLSLHGVASADFLLGKGTDRRKIQVNMDVFTNDLLGYLIYDNR